MVCALISVNCTLTVNNENSKYKYLYPIVAHNDYYHGYMNNLGQVVIEPKYTKAHPFSEGLAAVEINRKYGFINAQGEMIIKPTYHIASNFKNNLAKVAGDSMMADNNNCCRKGFINRKGKLIIPTQFVKASDFSDGYAAVTQYLENEYQDILGKFAKKLTDAILSSEATSSEKLPKFEVPNHTFIDRKGKLITQFSMSTNNQKKITRSAVDFGATYGFSEGLARVKIDQYYYFIDINLHIDATKKYQYVSDYSQGLAAIKISDRYGFIDKEGSIVVKPMYEEVKDFREDLAAVKVNGLWGYINRVGKLVIPTKYESVDHFSEGRAAVYSSKGDFAYVDNTGKLVTESNLLKNYLNKADPYKNGLAAIRLGALAAYIDRQNQVVWKQKTEFDILLETPIVISEQQKDLCLIRYQLYVKPKIATPKSDKAVEEYCKKFGIIVVGDVKEKAVARLLALIKLRLPNLGSRLTGRNTQHTVFSITKREKKYYVRTAEWYKKIHNIETIEDGKKVISENIVGNINEYPGVEYIDGDFTEFENRISVYPIYESKFE